MSRSNGIDSARSRMLEALDVPPLFRTLRSVKMMGAPELGEGIPLFGGAVAFCVEQ
jgi:hypothetical protein